MLYQALHLDQFSTMPAPLHLRISQGRAGDDQAGSLLKFCLVYTCFGEAQVSRNHIAKQV